MRATVLRSSQPGQSDGSARPAGLYGWRILTDGCEIDVHAFDSEDTQETFVKGVERVLGRDAEHTAALLAAWAWAEGDSRRELAGHLLGRLVEGFSAAALKGLDDLVGRAEEAQAARAARAPLRNAEADREAKAEASRPQPGGFPDLLRASPLAGAPGPERA